jgi:small subunit ribosomal protein S14
MAKTSSINRNDKRRKMTKLAEGRRKRLKALIANKQTSMEDRFAAAIKLAEMPRNSSKTRIRNRCEVTGRPRSYYRKLKMSRIALREMANNGLIPGMVKSSW